MPPASRVSNSALRLASPVSGSSSAAACRALRCWLHRRISSCTRRPSPCHTHGRRAADLRRDQTVTSAGCCQRRARASPSSPHAPRRRPPRPGAAPGAIGRGRGRPDARASAQSVRGCLGPGQLSGRPVETNWCRLRPVPGDGDAAVVDLPGEDVEHRPRAAAAPPASSWAMTSRWRTGSRRAGSTRRGSRPPVGDPGRGDVVGWKEPSWCSRRKVVVPPGAAPFDQPPMWSRARSRSSWCTKSATLRPTKSRGPAEALLDPGAHEPDGEVLADRHHEVEGVLHQRGVQDGSLGIDRAGREGVSSRVIGGGRSADASALQTVPEPLLLPGPSGPVSGTILPAWQHGRRWPTA